MRLLRPQTNPISPVHPSGGRSASTLRTFAWILLFALLAGVFLFPAQARPDTSTMPSVSVFQNLTVFSLLFYAWAVVLFAILLTTHEKSDGGFEGLLLSVVFSIGFVGFWVLVPGGSPGGDSAMNSAILRDIIDLGRLGDLQDKMVSSNLTYFDFPGLFLLGTTLHTILSLDVFTATKVTTLAEIVLLASLYYTIAWTYLRDQRWAALAAIWTVEGNVQTGFWPSFFPGNFGALFILMAVLLLLKAAGRTTPRASGALVLMLVMMGATISHSGAPIVLLAILGAVFIIRRDRAPGLVSATTLFLALVLPLAWEIYAAMRSLDPNIVRTFRAFLMESNSLNYVRIIGAANLGEVTPPWVSGLNLFWMVVTVSGGGLIALWRLVKIRSQPDRERIIVATLVGITAISLLFSFLTGGAETVYRIFLYGALFTVLTACSVILVKRHATRRLLQSVVVLALLALSLPTFLVLNRGVVLMRSFAYENRTAEFISASYPRGHDLVLYVHSSTGINLLYDLPGASFVAEAEVAKQVGSEGCLEGQEDVLESFLKRAATGSASLYVRYDDRVLMYYGRYFDVKTVEGPYGALMGKLEANSSKVYDSGETAIYANPLPSGGSQVTNPYR
jgi:hypothetical protein